jgi:hypothetical protein
MYVDTFDATASSISRNVKPAAVTAQQPRQLFGERIHLPSKQYVTGIYD